MLQPANILPGPWRRFMLRPSGVRHWPWAHLGGCNRCRLTAVGHIADRGTRDDEVHTTEARDDGAAEAQLAEAATVAAAIRAGGAITHASICFRRGPKSRSVPRQRGGEGELEEAIARPPSSRECHEPASRRPSLAWTTLGDEAAFVAQSARDAWFTAL